MEGEGADVKNTFWWGQDGKSLDWVGRDHHSVGRGKSVETRRDHLRQELEEVTKEGGYRPCVGGWREWPWGNLEETTLERNMGVAV